MVLRHSIKKYFLNSLLIGGGISMIGAIIGDVIGSVFEWHNVKTTEFKLFSRESKFTDDTVMTIAVADALLSKQTFKNPIKDALESRTTYIAKLKQYGHRYPNVGYGNMFNDWLKESSPKPYKSYGNGSAMRVSSIGFAFDTLEEVLKESKRSAKITHNHRDGIKGAQAVATAVFFAKNGESKDSIKHRLENMFKYNLSRKLDEIRPKYMFDSSCQGSVPEAIIAFLESEHFEDAIRKAISLGGDSDTIACITGAVAQAYYNKIPTEIIDDTFFRLDIGMKTIIRQFNEKYKVQY
jgi:ADP-ribosylglycohydrolase